MKLTTQHLFILLISILLLLVSCAPVPAVPTSTASPQPSATATITPRPSFTLRPTDTPYVAGTEAALTKKAVTQQYIESWRLQTQKYQDLGYLTDTEGTYRNYKKFEFDWAQLRWYRYWIYEGEAKNFYISAHFKWSSGYRNADPSGCGFIFDIQENGDAYSVFLDRNKILFFIYENARGYYRPVGLTHGTDVVSFPNPYDQPAEADFTVVVNDGYGYVLVNEELVAEYTLSTNSFYQGGFGPAVLSGTNKDFGTRCEMSGFHAWIQKE
jgi:hypothetical protein